MTYIDPKYFVGRRFYASDKKITYTAVGYREDGQGHPEILGENWDKRYKESKIYSIRLQDVHWFEDFTSPEPLKETVAKAFSPLSKAGFSTVIGDF